MSTIAALEPREIRHAISTPPRRKATLEEITQVFQELAEKVQTQWSEFSREERAALIELATLVTSPPRGFRWVYFSLIGGYFYTLNLVRGRVQVFTQYLGAVLYLVDSVLAALEAESKEYQDTLAAAVGESLGDTSGGQQGMSPAELNEWARSL